MEQTYSSKGSSINKYKLPCSIKHIDWAGYKVVLDYGGGKFDNLKEYLSSKGIELFIYDKYNRSNEENKEAMKCKPELVLCNNVLNVIQEDEIIEGIIKNISKYGVEVVFSIYEGDKGGKGRVTKGDQYQRNERCKEYLKFMKKYFTKIEVKGNLIFCN